MKKTAQTKLDKFLQRGDRSRDFSKPMLLKLSKSADKAALSKLVEKGAVQHVVDDYREQLLEYFQVQNPSLVYHPSFQNEFRIHLEKLQSKAPFLEQGTWVYFPWLSTLSHILDEEAFFATRTTRNKNLITAEEQERYYNAIVGIAGLSVGNSAALNLVLSGGARRIRLADFDALALSNTNRVRTGVQSLGLKKAEITAREIYTINPYAQVELFSDGLTKENIDTFFNGKSGKLDVVIDEIDNIAVKCLIREKAKKYRVPLVMAADNGDNGVVDIERYDLDPKLPFFHGRIGKVSYAKLAKLDKFGIGRTITQHIGPENITERMQESLEEMGKTIVSWPQLGAAALLNGAAIAYCVRRIVNGQELERNRSIISLDALLIPSYGSAAQKKRRAKLSKAFAQRFGL